MSEATKACPNVRCHHGRIVEVGACEYVGDTDMGECPDCKGAGRVPDIEATLRAQLDAATTQTQIVRLALASVLGRGHEERDVVELAADVVAREAQLRGEVDRLTTREREAARILSFVSTAHASAWSAEAEAWLAGCKS